MSQAISQGIARLCLHWINLFKAYFIPSESFSNVIKSVWDFTSFGGISIPIPAKSSISILL